MNAQQKLHTLVQSMDEALHERQQQARLALLGVVSGGHTLLLGPPGTGKSLLARSVARCFRDSQYFEHTLSAETRDDDVFGPVSLAGLERDEVLRCTAGHLPSADIAFLDEIFRATGSLRDALLSLLNERIFHHGAHRDEVPLLGLLAASNRLEHEGDEAAFADRFLVQVSIEPLRKQASFNRLCFDPSRAFQPPVEAQLERKEVLALRRLAQQVKVPTDIQGVLWGAREALRKQALPASDRRFRQLVDLLKLAALSSGRDRVQACDLVLCEACLLRPGGEPQAQEALQSALAAPLLERTRTVSPALKQEIADSPWLKGFEEDVFLGAVRRERAAPPPPPRQREVTPA